MTWKPTDCGPSTAAWAETWGVPRCPETHRVEGEDMKTSSSKFGNPSRDCWLFNVIYVFYQHQ